LTATPLGTHCILDLHGCPPERLDDERFVREAVVQASQEAHSTLLKLSSHKFDPQGVSAVGLLAESHLSIHTWPERGYAAVDIFTCGHSVKPREACANLVQRFAARRHVLRVLPRGAEAPAPDAAPDREASEEAGLCRART